METKLSIITLLSYDYIYLEDCIRSYYDIADEIILGVDKNRVSWSGNAFTFDMAFVLSVIEKIDTGKKVKIIEGDFFKYKEPIQNDTYERSYLSQQCKAGNWIISIDVDERLVNAEEFSGWLKYHDQGSDIRKYDIGAQWIQIFKVIDGKKILINRYEPTTVGTFKRGGFTCARLTGQPTVMSPLILEHYSWGRTREEIWQKLSNWSHTNDFNIKHYFDLWDSINLQNYRDFKNIHPLDKVSWPELIVDERS